MRETWGYLLTEPRNHAVIPFHKPSIREMLFFFISGIVMSIPQTLLAEQLSFSLVSISLSNLLSSILSIAILAPFIEEFSKAYPLFYRHGETERSIFNLGFLTGLGFGVAEFLTYMFVYMSPILVRLPILLFHATNTSITAYGIATKKPLTFYLLAVVLHFLVNFSSLLESTWSIGLAVALPSSYLLSWYLHGQTGEKIVV